MKRAFVFSVRVVLLCVGCILAQQATESRADTGMVRDVGVVTGDIARLRDFGIALASGGIGAGVITERLPISIEQPLTLNLNPSAGAKLLG